jgi:hypothetical protein
MRKVIVSALVLAAGLTAVRFGPPMVKREMKRCHEIMGGMQLSGQACACHEEPVKVTA